MPIMRSNEAYLGDGLYASFDGHTIWLKTQRADGEHRVALDPQVWEALQAFVSSHLRAAASINTHPINRTPDMEGVGAKVWRLDLDAHRHAQGVGPDQDATIASWFIESPTAHPFWHSYLLSLVHLRPMPDNRKTHIYLEGATHELVLVALNPYADRDLFVTTGKQALTDDPGHPPGGHTHGILLMPPNFAAQFIAGSDAEAFGRVNSAVEMVRDGKLSPDTDFRKQWIALFGDNMVRA